MRTVLIHYHLFKNAGSSLDFLLKASFPDRFVAREFVPPEKTIYSQVLQWLEDEPDALCFSSHTAVLPPPKLDNLNVIPIILLRHPIDRIASVYHYEKFQNSDNYGTQLARQLSFKDYVEKRLTLDWQLKNCHVAFLSGMYPECDTFSLELAIAAANELPLIGIVEDFKISVQRLNDLVVASGLPALVNEEPYENVNRSIFLPLEQRLKDIQIELGSDFYAQLVDLNSEDLQLYEYCRNKLHAS